MATHDDTRALAAQLYRDDPVYRQFVDTFRELSERDQRLVLAEIRVLLARHQRGEKEVRS
jgi:hypothetical protein